MNRKIPKTENQQKRKCQETKIKQAHASFYEWPTPWKFVSWTDDPGDETSRKLEAKKQQKVYFWRRARPEHVAGYGRSPGEAARAADSSGGARFFLGSSGGLWSGQLRWRSVGARFFRSSGAAWSGLQDWRVERWKKVNKEYLWASPDIFSCNWCARFLYFQDRRS